ncbi:AraC family transcriptional regulator ligand-binding domain-containing protein [Dinoroseobacter sp. PD6]|uniref:helix-turn-helix transcriptional regulator n=1 Tax=Dinoroseobacter sp. PD6 TaxID=3028384 RepID=UPI00237A88F3|nr:AraC family transcriptional regulator [Dinoroseobacter sp. PD6]MDD9719029.1 AraC family transcriptional regulator ligand-binding domain-containing protein [Dinoroseobacter sp. PD6]
MTASRSIPLIRAAAIAPMRRWLAEQAQDAGPLLARAGLDWVPEDNPLVPIPLRAGIRFLVEIARVAGPDAPMRIARERGVFEIGPIGSLALAAPTVRAALHTIARNMPRHCTHEFFTVEDCPQGVRIGDGWAINIGDAEARHHVQQYVAALVEGICHVSGASGDSLARVIMIPHPTFALGHLRPWLGDRVIPGAARPLMVEIPDAVADRPMPAGEGRDPGQDWLPIRAGATLSDSIGTLVESMLAQTPPSIERVASAASLSPRTLRRRLADEGTTLSEIVDRTRARLAIAQLASDRPPPLGALAQELGYAHQSALTRAAKRWGVQIASSKHNMEGG